MVFFLYCNSAVFPAFFLADHGTAAHRVRLAVPFSEGLSALLPTTFAMSLFAWLRRLTDVRRVLLPPWSSCDRRRRSGPTYIPPVTA